MHLNKNQAHHEMTKHVNAKLYFIRLEVSRGVIKLLKINKDENSTDLLTKGVPFAKLSLRMNLVKLCRIWEVAKDEEESIRN